MFAQPTRKNLLLFLVPAIALLLPSVGMAGPRTRVKAKAPAARKASAPTRKRTAAKKPAAPKLNRLVKAKQQRKSPDVSKVTVTQVKKGKFVGAIKTTRTYSKKDRPGVSKEVEYLGKDGSKVVETSFRPDHFSGTSRFFEISRLNPIGAKQGFQEQWVISKAGKKTLHRIELYSKGKFSAGDFNFGRSAAKLKKDLTAEAAE